MKSIAFKKKKKISFEILIIYSLHNKNVKFSVSYDVVLKIFLFDQEEITKEIPMFDPLVRFGHLGLAD